MPSILGSHILLTGATGLIGGELAHALVKHSAERVSCLVRNKNNETALSRVHRRLERSCDRLSRKELGRVHAIEGDIIESDLGLQPFDRRELQHSVDIIIHAAAETSFIRDEQCREINIKGVENIIEFAKSCAKPPLLVYISTACNVGEVSHTCISEEEGCRPGNRHHNEYTHSKAIAEEKLRRSELPFLIVRPSIVLSAGLEDAEFARQILWVAPVFSQFQCLPIDLLAKIDTVPVSFVTEALIHLINLPGRKFDCYNLSAGKDYSMTMEYWVEGFSRHYHANPPLQTIPWSSWKRSDTVKYIVTPQQRKLFFALRYYLPFLNMDVTFDNSRLRAEADVETLGLVRPEIYLERMLDHILLEDALEESLNP